MSDALLTAPGIVPPRIPVPELEDALNEGIYEREVGAKDRGIRFAEVPDCPFLAEGVVERVVFVQDGCYYAGSGQ
jgi:hypothetical protein